MDVAEGKYYMSATQFEEVGTTGGIAIKDLVKGKIPYGAQMQILGNDGIYAIYNYIEEAYDEESDDFYPGWADSDDYLAVRKLPSGTAFWFKAPANCNVTIAGMILDDASKQIDVAGGKFSMIASPYPVGVNLNALTWTGLTYGDQIQVMGSDGIYSIYNYIEEAYDEAADDFYPGWADSDDYLVVSDVIPVANGAWIKPTAALTIEFNSPITK